MTDPPMTDLRIRNFDAPAHVPEPCGARGWYEIPGAAQSNEYNGPTRIVTVCQGERGHPEKAHVMFFGSRTIWWEDK